MIMTLCQYDELLQLNDARLLRRRPVHSRYSRKGQALPMLMSCDVEDDVLGDLGIDVLFMSQIPIAMKDNGRAPRFISDVPDQGQSSEVETS